MVRNTRKLTKFGSIAAVGLALLSPTAINHNTYALCATYIPTGERYCDEKNGTFQVSVNEILTVDLSGLTDTVSEGTYLEKKVTLTVDSNNAYGFEATLSSEGGTDLVNSAKSSSIPTLTGNTIRNVFRSSSTAAWGYSANGNNDNTLFSPLTTTAKQIFHNDSAGRVSNDIYFGANGSGKVADTYARAVQFAVTSGVHTEPPTNSNPGGQEDPGINDPVTPNPGPGVEDPTPSNPNGPSAENPSVQPGAPEGPTVGVTGNSGNSSNSGYNYGSTSGSSSSSSSSKDKTSSSSSKNNSSYDGYNDPQGVTNTVAAINEGTPLVTGLAITALIAAIVGIFFFLLAKRRKDDEDEEQY